MDVGAELYYGGGWRVTFRNATPEVCGERSCIFLLPAAPPISVTDTYCHKCTKTTSSKCSVAGSGDQSLGYVSGLLSAMWSYFRDLWRIIQMTFVPIIICLREVRQ